MKKPTNTANTKKEATEKKSLSELAEHWKQLARKTAEQRKKAEDYYENILMEPIVETFIRNNRTQVTESVECLILSVGHLMSR